MYTISVSPGELLDRLTILKVKKEYLASSRQLDSVDKEIENLAAQASALLLSDVVRGLADELFRHNNAMWQAMQAIYDWDGQHNTEFELAILSVIELNKERAHVKRKIDLHLGSEVMEAKSFFESK